MTSLNSENCPQTLIDIPNYTQFSTAHVTHIINDTKYAVHSIVGRANEDRSNLCILNGKILMYAIYDGHGGCDVSNYLKDRLPEKIADMLSYHDWNDESVIIYSITNAFVSLDFEMWNQNEFIGRFSGSTATVVLSYGGKIYMAHVGDSRAILADRNGHILLETADHDGYNRSEIERITNLGGFVSSGVVPRISGLAVTRAFGNFNKGCKISPNGYRSDWYVSVVPEVNVFNKVDQNPILLLIASDGLWDGKYKKSSNVLKMINDINNCLSTKYFHIDMGYNRLHPHVDIGSNKGPTMVDIINAKQLCHHIALKGHENYAGYKDDITVITAFI